MSDALLICAGTFFDAAKVNKKDSRAHKALLYIRRIYEIESSLSGKELSDDEFVRQRKGAAVPILNEFHAWLMKTNREILPKSSTGKAVSYALNEWSKLLRYLDEAFLAPDNNAARMRSVHFSSVARIACFQTLRGAFMRALRCTALWKAPRRTISSRMRT